MRLDELVTGFGIRQYHGPKDVEIHGVDEDSRAVGAGWLFVARAGLKTDGSKFIASAVNAGASAVLTEDPSAVPESVAALTADDIPAAGAKLAERLAGNPSQRLRLIGVTGTNGKTTTTSLIKQMLDAAGKKCGLVGTVMVDDGQESVQAEMTTPAAGKISELLRRRVKNGCEACAMETSSHALEQRRTAGLNFEAGVFTNLTGDHLDYHGTMDAYRNAKAILFKQLPKSGVAVLNMDDPAWESMAKVTQASVVTCSLRNSGAMALGTIRRQTIKGTEMTARGPWGSWDVFVPLIGAHNMMNVLQAAAVCAGMGVEAEVIREAMCRCAAPAGRLEPVTSEEDAFTVLVDYAHTDDALENVLRALRPIVGSEKKLRVAFGCGGNRDATKRPRMAKVAWTYADDVTVTSDNPRLEEPMKIIEMILAGVPAEKRTKTEVEADRAKAIRSIIGRAEAGDIVVIAGKGHEDYQIIGSTKFPFDDRVVAKDALRAEEGSLVEVGGAR
ncbi:MAG TPA: UDP-N-acetylmuramoyl-L-alanyl-D-glutamate--2,6-diaminopimelate ligase [Phycisphaerales bacterium]|nr:UDP-N-acetylmuramoyl-L-alanyl-D-glutamate--2,6-diaminopimelate ligase [Phycisphaerales bacterium]